MNPQEAYRKMRKDLGLDSKSGYKDSGVGNGNDPWRSYESGTSSVAKPNHGQGFSSKGYNPKPGERTRDQRL